ncbi:hypothetical protein RJ640_017058 [Escallonia rubra]|uniref:tRNA-intron lyase n=1 Tax=Escallonia rubra TaxID=112253 RepID=A0AA88QDD4_9ASTE|nr:hypothetical protein RJ640_017058 [Escallonia rubra]
MGPRWKRKGAEAKALADPMSKTVSDLQSSLMLSNSQGILSGRSVLLGADAAQTELLSRACFGQPIITAEKDIQWFELSMEEGFYLCYSLRCIKIVGEDKCVKDEQQVWKYMTSKWVAFPVFFKAYSHLRMKNWVVRSGSQYGVDFVAYRHHPSLVHSEYAVLVLSKESGDANGRLRVWSDFHCTLRLCGSVAKTLLAINIDSTGKGVTSPSCLDSYEIEERTVTRWTPEECRENQIVVENRTKRVLLEYNDISYSRMLPSIVNFNLVKNTWQSMESHKGGHLTRSMNHKVSANMTRQAPTVILSGHPLPFCLLVFLEGRGKAVELCATMSKVVHCSRLSRNGVVDLRRTSCPEGTSASTCFTYQLDL